MMNKFLVILTLVSAVSSEIKAEKYTDVHDVYNRCYPTLPWNRYKDVCGPEFAKLRDEINKLDASGRTVLDRALIDGGIFRRSAEAYAAKAAAKIIKGLGGKTGRSVRDEIERVKQAQREEERKAAAAARLKAESDRKSQEAERLAKAEPSRARDILVPVKTGATGFDAETKVYEGIASSDIEDLLKEQQAAKKDSDLLKWGRCCC